MRFYQHDVPMGIVRFEDMPLIRSQNRIASESTGLSCWSGTARLGSLEMSKEALRLPWLMGLVYEDGEMRGHHTHFLCEYRFEVIRGFLGRHT